MKLNNRVCLLIASLYSLSTIYFMLKPCFVGDYKTLYIQYYFTIGMFTFLGVAFFYTGLTMNFSLKRYFPQFYMNYRCILWATCFSLTIPLFLRAIVNLSATVSGKFQNWFVNPDHVAYSFTLYLMFSTYIPIITQMSSLVFGFLRTKQDAKLIKDPISTVDNSS